MNLRECEDEPEDLFESTPETDPVFPVVVDRKLIWAIQQIVHPGMPVLKTDLTMALPGFRWQQYALALRWKVNTAILRFEDEDDTKEIELSLTEAEGWILDQSIPFDGPGGTGALLLVQIFRGMWRLRMDEMGAVLPSYLVPEPALIPAEDDPGKQPPVQPPSNDLATEIYQWLDAGTEEPPTETA